MQKSSHKLTDILGDGAANSLRRNWTETKAEFDPLPPGEYEARIIGGQFQKSKFKGTPNYNLTFRVLSGPYAGRTIWDPLWLTDAALSYTKRKLEKLGVTDLDQLNQPLPSGVLCRIKVVIWSDDYGGKTNKVKDFEVVSIGNEMPYPFAPTVANKNAEGDGDVL